MTTKTRDYHDAVLNAYQATNSAELDVGLDDFDSLLHKQLALASQALRIAYVMVAEKKQ